jgi:hypothetical protein
VENSVLAQGLGWVQDVPEASGHNSDAEPSHKKTQMMNPRDSEILGISMKIPMS